MKSKSATPRKPKQKQPIKHSKSFSGCWTCRSRHVRCTEERPECARCLKGGFQCQGYGIKLSWVDPTTQEREQNVRRVIGRPTVYDEHFGFVGIDVDRCLEKLDAALSARRTLGFGPFRVFSVGSTGDGRAKDVELTAPIAPQLVPVIISELSAVEGDDLETVVSPTISNYTSSYSDTPWSPASPHSTTAIFPTRHLDLLPRPAEQRALIHHWTNFVCWHIVPVDRHDNPFRSVFTPMAMMGLTSPSATSNASIALFHAICATAAYSRGQLLAGDGKAVTLADKHYHLAITHLRHSLTQLDHNTSDARTQRSSILATITTFSAMDMITARSGEWRTHLQGAATWLGTIGSTVWQQDKSSSAVYQGYLAVAALCNVDLPSSVGFTADSSVMDGQAYLLDRFFGLTKPILANIIRMNALIKETNAAGRDPDAEALNELEVELYAQDPRCLELPDVNEMTRQLTIHHACIFYYASLIHFLRSLRQLPPQHHQVQTFVAEAVDRLEAIEAIGGESIGCTLVWPPFVIACECVTPDMQQRVLDWYMVKRRHGFMNLEKSKDIALEVWRRRQATPDANVRWQEVLKHLGIDIVLA